MNKLDIQVIGTWCASCKALYTMVEKIAQEIDSRLSVTYITDVTKIIELWVMSSPVFVIDGEIITAGKAISEQQIKEAILAKYSA